MKTTLFLSLFYAIISSSSSPWYTKEIFYQFHTFKKISKNSLSFINDWKSNIYTLGTQLKSSEQVYRETSH